MPDILVVEDDPLAQEITVSILQSQGLDVDIAADGFAALRLLREIAYRTALIDYHLPEMDGFALARLMRDITRDRPTPLQLIGVTADRFGLAARRGADRLFDEIIAKPYQPAELIALMKKPVSQRREPEHAVTGATDSVSGARLAAAALWKKRGIDHIPRARVLPAPTPRQRDAVRMCFDIVDDDSAELLLLIDGRGFQALLRSRTEGSISALPIVTLDRTLAGMCDACFVIGEPETWSLVANVIAVRDKLAAPG